MEVKLSYSQLEYITGLSSALVSVVATYPINKVFFRQVLFGFDTWTVLRQLWQEGLPRLYRGVSAPIILKSASASVMFGSYKQFHDMLLESDNLGPYLARKPVLTSFIAAMLAGSTEALLTPFERVQLLLQDGRFNHLYRNTFDSMVKIGRFGLKEYFRGMSAILLRNGPSTFLYFGFKDHLRMFILPGSGHNEHQSGELLRDFLAGAIMGCLINTVFFPLNTVKNHMQSQEAGAPHLGVFEATSRLYYERIGYSRVLLVGIYANMIRSFFFWGCVTACSEYIRSHLENYIHH